mgnify:CR=1 FL=1
MKIFNFETKIDIISIKQYFELRENDIFFDIETTGLSRKYSHIYMIGIGKIENESYKITQFFAETVLEERKVIETFLTSIPEYSRLITYNGDRFDLPFVAEKNEQFQNMLNNGFISSFDIYKAIKPLKSLLKLPALKQKNIEVFLGINREDKFDGGKLIKVYEEYQKRPDDENEHLLIIHNREDVYGMLMLLKIFKYFQIKKFNFTNFSMIKELDEIIFRGSTDLDLPTAIRIDHNDMYIILDKNIIKGICPLYDGRMKHFFPNINDYVYLIDEEKIIPKVLSSGINAERYRKPTKDECFIYVENEKINDSFLENEIKNLFSGI